MFARNDTAPIVMVAPSGARKSKADHPTLPITIQEIRDETIACAAAGADALHLHVRDATGRHSLDPGLYREAISEIHRALPGFPIQITTEAAGLFDVDVQLHCLKTLRPRAASISIQEIARSPDLAPQVYGLCQDAGISVQHILYNHDDWHHFLAWRNDGVIRDGQDDVIFVLGSYTPPKAAAPSDVQTLAPRLPKVPGRAMVCAFGPVEHDVLCAAAALGADLRVGFENNLRDADGQLAASNAANVARLKAAITARQPEGISP